MSVMQSSIQMPAAPRAAASRTLCDAVRQQALAGVPDQVGAVAIIVIMPSKPHTR